MTGIIIKKNRTTALIAAVLLMISSVALIPGEPAYAELTTKKQWGKEITDAKLNKYNGKSYYYRLPGVNMYACTGYAEWALNSVYGISVPSYPLVRYLRAYFMGKGNKIVAYGSHVASKQGGNGKYYSYGEIKPGDIVFFFKRGTNGKGKITMGPIKNSTGYRNTHGTHRWTHVAIVGGNVSGKNGISSRLHHNNTVLGVHYSGTIKSVLSMYASDKGATDYQIVRVIAPDEAFARVKKTYSRKEWYDREPYLAGAVFKVAGQTFKTDKNGNTKVSKPVRSGTYSLKETKAPSGFDLMSPNPKKVKLISGKTTVVTVKDAPKQGKRPLKIIKKMTANGTELPEEKAVFRIWPVKYGKHSSKASWWKKIPSGVKDQVTTGSDGTAQTKKLPCESSVFSGQYYVHQTKGPGGVRLAKNKKVTLGKGTTVVKWTYKDLMTEHPSIVKKDALTGETVAEEGITFRLKKKGAFQNLQRCLEGESVESDEVVNAFLSDDPVSALSGLGVEIEDAGWVSIGGKSSFVTSDEGEAEIKKVNAEDVGEYEIYETVSPKDFKLPGYRLAAVDPDSASDLDKPVPFTLKAVTSTVSVNYNNMPSPEIGTQASDSDTGDSSGRSMKDAEITDTVAMENMETGKTYTLFGTLMNKETGKPVVSEKGAPVRASIRFEADAQSMTREMKFRFDAGKTAGKDVVVFERLYEGGFDQEPEEIEPLAVHEDIEDEGQTVRYPGGHTEALDQDSGTHTGCISEEAVIVDRFIYENLIEGNEYKVKGTLYDKDTGKPLVSGGKKVTAEETFTAGGSKGEVSLEFRFDSSFLQGKTLVVGEELLRNGKTVLVHFDLEDREQSIYYPSIHTMAKDRATGSRTGEHSEEAVIIDTVKYEHLTPGETYVMTGYLADAGTGKPLTLSSGKVKADSDSSARTVSASVKFTPKKQSGTVDVRFRFDSTRLAGKKAVVFEQLFYKGREIASHMDRKSRVQTVSYPSIETEAEDAASGSHTAKTGKVTIVDTVSYSNLTPGKRYVIKGQLVVKSTGKLLKDGGKIVEASKKFIPRKRSGRIVLKFGFDASGLNGETVVAFENLFENGALVASHSDVKDRAQSVLIRNEGSPATGDDQVELVILLATVSLLAAMIFIVMLLAYREKK